MPSPFDRDLVATYLRPQRPRLVLLAILLLAGIALQLANPLLAAALIDAAQRGAAQSSYACAVMDAAPQCVEVQAAGSGRLRNSILAMALRWTSSGPSTMRTVRWWA